MSSKVKATKIAPLDSIPVCNYEAYALPVGIAASTTSHVVSKGGPHIALSPVPDGDSQVPVKAQAKTSTAHGSSTGGSGKSGNGRRGKLVYSNASTPVAKSKANEPKTDKPGANEPKAEAIPASESKYGTEALLLLILHMASKFRLEAEERKKSGKEQKQLSNPDKKVEGTVCSNADCCIDPDCKANNHSNPFFKVRQASNEAYKKYGLLREPKDPSKKFCIRGLQCFTGLCVYDHGKLWFKVMRDPVTGEEYDVLTEFCLELSDYYVRKAIQNLEHIKNAINAHKNKKHTTLARLKNNLDELEEGGMSREDKDIRLANIKAQFPAYCKKLVGDRRDGSKKWDEFIKYYPRVLRFVPNMADLIDPEILDTIQSYMHMDDSRFDVDSKEEFPGIGNPLPHSGNDVPSYLGALMTPPPVSSETESGVKSDLPSDPELPIPATVELPPVGEESGKFSPDDSSVAVASSSVAVASSSVTTPPTSVPAPSIPDTVEHPHNGVGYGQAYGAFSRDDSSVAVASSSVTTLDTSVPAPPIPNTAEHPHVGVGYGPAYGAFSSVGSVYSPPLPPFTDPSVYYYSSFYGNPVDASPTHGVELPGYPLDYACNIPEDVTYTTEESYYDSHGVWHPPEYVAKGKKAYYISADGIICPVFHHLVFGPLMPCATVGGEVFLVDQSGENVRELLEYLDYLLRNGYPPFGTADSLPVALDQPPPVY
jgi:hypothetical protein